MARICVVEDEEKLRRELCVFLERYGYTCVWTDNFQEIPRWVQKSGGDLLLLDINLPGTDGYSICRELRRISSIPIIMITSRDTEMDELLSMNFGADDFVAKPYNRQILLARIHAVLRRSGSAQLSFLEYKGVVLDPSRGTVSFGEKEAELTKNELWILRMLMGNPGKIVSREEIMRELWQSEEFVDDNTLTVNINRLRRKLEETGVRDFLVTKRGQGYLV